MNPVFTIGHSNHDFGTFRDLLLRHRIELVVDVRSVPYSRRFPQYVKRTLAAALGDTGVEYIWLGDSLGGRQETGAAVKDRAAHYDSIAGGAAFQAGLDRVVAVARTRIAALMCAEREPMQCHRALLVSRHLAGRGVDIRHILAGGRAEPLAEFEERLVQAAGAAPPPLFDSAAGRAAALSDAYDQAARGFKRR